MSKKITHRLLEPLFKNNPALRSAYKLYRHIKSNKTYFSQPQAIPLGFKFNGNPVMEKGEFEPAETALIQKLLTQVDLVINVGANIGYYSCLALKQNKKVVVFEPIDANLRYLLRNIKANGWESNAEVFSLALSDQVGVLEIYGGGTGASLIEGWSGTPKDDVTLVPVSTLDIVLGERFAGQKILFIIDIEGAEKMMLDGAQGFLSMTPKPIWLIEITAHQHQPEGVSVNPHLLETFEKFWNCAYQSWNVGKLVKQVTKDDILHLAQSDGSAEECANYLFTENTKVLMQAGVVLEK